jgi:hypothetical protein
MRLICPTDFEQKKKPLRENQNLFWQIHGKNIACGDAHIRLVCQLRQLGEGTA